MKKATKMVLIFLFTVVPVSFQETTSVMTLNIVGGTNEDVTTSPNTINKITETTTAIQVTPTATRHISTTTITTISNAVECKNGGVYDGIKCICPALYYGPLCESLADEIPSERCMEVIPESYKEFYDAIHTSAGLICVSHCNPTSPNFVDCNSGICRIEFRKGPTCYCPNADVYMYSRPRCMGRISKIGLFAGIGVTIGVLLILLVVLIIYCLKTEKKSPKMLIDEEAYYSTIK